MDDNKIKKTVNLSNEILREIKLSNYLNEEKGNIKRLESINWKYKNKKYNISILSLEEEPVNQFMNAIINKNMFLEEYNNLRIPTIEINNIKIKNYFSIKKILLDGKKETLKAKMNDNLEAIFNEEIVSGDKANLEKYIIEKDLDFINDNEEFELIKNLVFSKLKLKDISKIVNTTDINKIKIINNNQTREIINSDIVVVILNCNNYLSRESKILIKNILEDLDESHYYKIHLVIDKNLENIDNIQIESELNEFVKKYKPLCENLNVNFISLEEAEMLKVLKGDINNDEFKEKFKNKYNELININNDDKQSNSLEYIISEQLYTLLKNNGFEDFENKIINTIFDKAYTKFWGDTKKNIAIVLENISTKLSSKINSLNKNNDKLYEISEEIKDEINKMNLENYNLKYIAENEFKDTELNIGQILKSLKNTIFTNIENNLIKDNYLSSYDKNSLAIIIKDIQENILSSSQVIIDRELDKIKMLCVESQYKIYIESQYKLGMESQKKLNTIARNKFNELVKEFTKTTAQENTFNKNDFEVTNYINNFSDTSNYIYSSYESNGTYTETKFDSSGAMIGTLSFGLAGMTISGLIGVLVPFLDIWLMLIIGTIFSSMIGFFTTFRKEIVKEKEVKIYKVDMKMLRGDISDTVNKMVTDTTKYTSMNFKKFKNKHMEFLESDMSKFLCCLGDDSCNIINTHKDEMNEMIDLKFKVDKYIKEFVKLKSMTDTNSKIEIYTKEK